MFCLSKYLRKNLCGWPKELSSIFTVSACVQQPGAQVGEYWYSWLHHRSNRLHYWSPCWEIVQKFSTCSPSPFFVDFWGEPCLTEKQEGSRREMPVEKAESFENCNPVVRVKSFSLQCAFKAVNRQFLDYWDRCVSVCYEQNFFKLPLMSWPRFPLLKSRCKTSCKNSLHWRVR